MNALWFDEPLQDSDSLLCVEPDGDHNPPFAQLSFRGAGVIDAGHAVAGDVIVEVMARDNRSGLTLDVSVAVDGVPVERAAYLRSFPSGPLGVWPVRLPLLRPGERRIEAIIRDAAKNETRLSQVLEILAQPLEEPLISVGTAPAFKLQVEGERGGGQFRNVRSNTQIRIDFTQPVRGVTGSTLYLTKAGVVVPTRILSLAGYPTATTRVYQVYLEYEGRLELGATYVVHATGGIQQDGPLNPKALAPRTEAFVIETLAALGSTPFPGVPGHMALLGRRLFTVNTTDHAITQHWVEQLTGAATAKIVAQGTVPGFTGQQSVDALGAFPAVALGDGTQSDLLLVTTSGEAQQGVLWGFKLCPQPALLFTISLGMGSGGYAPSLDCRDGLIVVGRLTSSVLLISVAEAVKQGVSASAAMSPAGFGQAAIIQPFYFTDPAAAVSEAAGIPTHWGVGLLPLIGDSGSQGILQVVAGYNGAGAQWRGITMRGAPTFVLAYDSTKTFRPQPAYLPDPASKALDGGGTAPAADARANPGVLRDVTGEATYSFTRLSVLPQTLVTTGNQQRLTNLAVGLSSLPGAGGLVNSLAIMDEQAVTQARLIGRWPQVDSPFNQTVNGATSGDSYEIVRSAPALDPHTSLAAIPVKNLRTQQTLICVLDLSTPNAPATLSSSVPGTACALRNGLLAVAAPSGGTWRLNVYRAAQAKAGLEEGCTMAPFQVTLSADEVLPTLNLATPERPPTPNGYNQVGITIAGKPSTTYSLSLSADATAGGHDHYQTTPTHRPTGTLPPQIITDADGQGRATYVAPLIGGTVTLKVVEAGTGDVVQRDIRVRVPGLVQLPSGDGLHYRRKPVSPPNRHLNYS